MAGIITVKKQIWTVDCETDPFAPDEVPEPFLWGAYNPEQGYHEFNDTAKFVEFITSGEKLVYAHNGGKFDYLYLADWLENNSEILFIAGRAAKFEIGDAEFRDSMSIIPAPLSDYKKTEVDYSKFHKSVRHRHMREISEYLQDDCVFLHELVSAFHAEFGDYLTIASCSLDVWTKMSKIKKPRSTAGFYDELKKFYYGGRNQCFKSGIINRIFTLVDINSAYPWAMCDDHAYGFDFEVTTKLPKKDVGQCFIELTCVSKGALPFREDGVFGLQFPNDSVKRRYSITGWEYLAAVKHHALSQVEIHYVYTFKKRINFKKYVDKFYRMKSQCKADGDDARYIFAKILLNALYGKYAANPDNYRKNKIVKPCYVEALEQAEGYEFSNWFGPWALCEKRLDDEEKRYHNVATAASITGKVRAYLYDALMSVDKPIYCDTDSIACESTGTLKLHDSNLGAWGFEMNCDLGYFCGKKLYAIRNRDYNEEDPESKEWKIASKGGRLDHHEIKRVAKGETVKFRPDAPVYSWKRGIRHIDKNFEMTT